MRPLHALVLLLVLAGALVAGLLLIGGDPAETVASPTSETAAEGTTDSALPPAAPLDPTGAGADLLGRAVPAGEGLSTLAPAAVQPGAGDAAGLGLKGRVVGPFGQPVARATVYASAANGFDEIPLDAVDPLTMPWFRRADATTDAEGRFTIRPDARGKVRLAVRASGFAPHDATIAMPGADKSLPDITLEASAVLEGRVLDPAGRPVAGAELLRQSTSNTGLFFTPFQMGARLATTDAEGQFKVDQLAVGPWKLKVTSADHPDKVESGETERPGTVVAGLEFVLEEGFEIQGRITGAPADSLGKLSVRATPRPAGEDGPAVMIEAGGGFTAGQGRTGRVSPDGTFTVRGCKRGASYRLVAREGERDFFGRVRTAAVQARSGDRGVSLPYRSESALVFQAVDAATGAPVTDLSVQAGWRWKMPLLDEENRPMRRFPEGRVRFGSLPPRPQREGSGAGSGASEGFSLRVESAGYAPYERKNLDLVEGVDLDLGVVRLERAPVVRVLVLEDASGKPVAGASASLVEEEPDGRSGFGRAMSLDIEDEMGDHGAAFGSGSAQRAKTGEDGRAVLTSLPGQTATLRVRFKGFADHRSAPIALPSAGDLEQVVRLKAGGRVIVEVVDSSGAAVPGEAVDHEGPHGEAAEFRFGGQGETLTDADGRVEFSHLPEGAHRFRLREAAEGGVAFGGGAAIVRRMRRAGGEEAREEGWSQVVVTEGSLDTLKLVAPARSALAGRITEGGKPLADALVRLEETGSEDAQMRMFAVFGGGPEARTNGKGEYTIEGVRVGDWGLRISHASRAMPYEGETKLSEGRNELDLDLPVAIVEGRVTDQDKKPVAGARVHAERAKEEGQGRSMMAYSVMVTADGGGGDEHEMTFSSGDTGPTVVTDAQGRYTLRGVLPDVDLVVKASGKDLQPGESKPFHVAPDQVKSGVDIELAAGGVIEASVVRPAGGPATGCMVRASPDEEGGPAGPPAEPKMQVVGPTGVARLTGLKPGRWRVAVEVFGPFDGGDAPSIPEQVIEVKAGATAKARFEMP